MGAADCGVGAAAGEVGLRVSAVAMHTIRPIDPASDAEIDLVAQRMRLTLIEVEGEVVGTALYTMDWLRERVRWHLDFAQATAQVCLAIDPAGDIVGHMIVRVESDDEGERFGLFSTTYVRPESRQEGVAIALLLHGEQWMRAQGLQSAATWTSASNAKLICLYVKHGYVITERVKHATTQAEMVKLARAGSSSINF